MKEFSKMIDSVEDDRDIMVKIIITNVILLTSSLRCVQLFWSLRQKEKMFSDVLKS